MTTRPDANTPEAPQEATEGRHSVSEGASGQRETPRGQNGPQTAAQSLDGEQQPRGPVDWARQQAAGREQGTPGLDVRVRAAVRDALAAIPSDSYTDLDVVSAVVASAALAEVHRVSTLAHNAGPSVAECAQADRRWPLEKHGE